MPAVLVNGVPETPEVWNPLRAKLSRAYFDEDSQIPKPTVEEYKEITSGHGHH